MLAPARAVDATPAVAVMQPYVFPYLGYFSLVQACDDFVFYDDVQHVTRGWVHRNRILLNGAAHTFTVPLSGSSQNVRIDELHTHDFATFRRHFVRQLECAYRRAPCFATTMELVLDVLDLNDPGIAELAMRSVERVSAAIGLERRFLRASRDFAATRSAGRAERLVAITRRLGRRRYVNAPGGMALYDKADFEHEGLTLQFVQPRLPAYPQLGGRPFVPGLSVIDALMHNPPEHVAELVAAYDLL